MCVDPAKGLTSQQAEYLVPHILCSPQSGLDSHPSAFVYVQPCSKLYYFISFYIYKVYADSSTYIKNENHTFLQTKHITDIKLLVLFKELTIWQL